MINISKNLFLKEFYNSHISGPHGQRTDRCTTTFDRVGPAFKQRHIEHPLLSASPYTAQPNTTHHPTLDARRTHSSGIMVNQSRMIFALPMLFVASAAMSDERAADAFGKPLFVDFSPSKVDFRRTRVESLRGAPLSLADGANHPKLMLAADARCACPNHSCSTGM